jgi:hypothetical protein
MIAKPFTPKKGVKPFAIMEILPGPVAWQLTCWFSPGFARYQYALDASRPINTMSTKFEQF